MSFTPENTSANDQRKAEWQTRVELAAAYRLIALYGWDDLVFTHLSARVPGPDHHFLINPYGLLFHEITASSLVKVDLDGNIISSAGVSRINPAGFTIHSAVHAVREDAISVMHIHAADGVAVSAHQEGLLPLSQTAMLCLPHLSYHDYEGVALNHDERVRVQEDLGTKPMLILRNHGLLTTGRSVGEAFTYLYFLMKACEIQVKALGCGPVYQPSQASLETTREQAAGLGETARLTWPALLRMADVRCAGYAV